MSREAPAWVAQPFVSAVPVPGFEPVMNEHEQAIEKAYRQVHNLARARDEVVRAADRSQDNVRKLTRKSKRLEEQIAALRAENEILKKNNAKLVNQVDQLSEALCYEVMNRVK